MHEVCPVQAGRVLLLRVHRRAEHGRDDLRPVQEAVVSGWPVRVRGVQRGRALLHRHAHAVQQLQQKMRCWILHAGALQRKHVRIRACQLCTVHVPRCVLGCMQAELPTLDRHFGKLVSLRQLDGVQTMNPVQVDPASTHSSSAARGHTACRTKPVPAGGWVLTTTARERERHSRPPLQRRRRQRPLPPHLHLAARRRLQSSPLQPPPCLQRPRLSPWLP